MVHFKCKENDESIINKHRNQLTVTSGSHRDEVHLQESIFM